jgi:arylsulfatase A-like enzyme
MPLQVHWKPLIVLTVLFIFPMSISAEDGAPKFPRPNFVVMIADDMSWDDCGAYGHPKIQTPRIDRLAAQGMRFDNAFLTCSSCSPSRASLMTGRYPHNTGAHQLHMPLPAEQVTFMELLRDAGYYTAASGKWHLGQAAQRKLDLVRTERRMSRWPRQLKAVLTERPKDRPFCMWLASTDPHRPYQSGTIAKPHESSDVRVPPYLPDVTETREDLALYYDEISRFDAAVGTVLDELEEQGVADNTVIVVLSDNGRPFPRCKTTVYDSGIKTPWIVRWPKRVKAGSRCSSLISAIDLAPTLLEAAGLKVPASFQGVSLSPLLEDPTRQTRRFVFAEHNWHDFDDCGRAVRSLRYKYIRNYYDDVPGTPPADAVRSITFQAMLKLNDVGKLTIAQRNPLLVPRPNEELYDTQKDPHELTNLAANPQYQAELAEMRTALDEWRKKTSDAVPQTRRPDGFDRVTGERLAGAKRR